MRSLFTNLLHYSSSSNLTELENFFTEIFAHLLNSEPTIFESFIGLISTVQPNLNNTITTQQSFDLIDRKKINRPDIFIDITTEKSRCVVFVESKIDSDLHVCQFKKYVNELNEFDVRDEKHFLCLSRDCQKNFSYIFKDIPTVNIHFIRWFEIYNLLKSLNLSNDIVTQTLNFMEEKGMAIPNQLKPADLIALNNFPKIQKFMEETISGKARAQFKDIVTTVAKPSTALTELRSNRRFIYYSNQRDKMWVGYGYFFKENEEYPDLKLIIDFPPSIDDREKIMDILEKVLVQHQNWESYGLTKPRSYFGIFVQLPFKKFLKDDNHIESIVTFFKTSFNELSEIKENTPEFPWL